MRKRVWGAILALSCAGAARGEEQAGKPRGPLVPLKVQVVFTRTLGEKKIGSLPYTLSVQAGSAGAAIMRMGSQVPLTMRFEANVPAPVTYKDIGTNLDCRAEALDEGRFKLDLSLEQSSLASGEGGASGAPILRSFKSGSSLILRDGQTGRYIAATDPVSGEVLQIDVTLNVVK